MEMQLVNIHRKSSDVFIKTNKKSTLTRAWSILRPGH